jgi:hypothetical protein
MEQMKISAIAGLILFGAFLWLLPQGEAAQPPSPGFPQTVPAAQRIVISGTIDLNSVGDEVRETLDSLGVRRVHHFRVFSILDLTTADPPAVQLYRRKRTDLVPGLPTAGFVLANLVSLGANASDNDSTVIVVEEGKILLRYRVEIFNADDTLRAVRFGLDGPGGTGEFRLVLIR